MIALRNLLLAAILVVTAPALAQSLGQGPMGPGMMGQGATGGGMMTGQSQAGPGTMPMMNMIMRGWSGPEHIEGRLAYIKAELKISDAQTPQWNAFADATRANAKAMFEIRGTMMSRQSASVTLPDKLALEEKAVTAHLEALKKIEDAASKLYGMLTDEQKKLADSIIIGPMGMPMGMM